MAKPQKRRKRKSGRDRTRRYRARIAKQCRGFWTFHDEVDLAQRLLAGGFLDRNLADEPKEIQKALQSMIDEWLPGVVTRHNGTLNFLPS